MYPLTTPTKQSETGVVQEQAVNQTSAEVSSPVSHSAGPPTLYESLKNLMKRISYNITHSGNMNELDNEMAQYWFDSIESN